MTEREFAIEVVHKLRDAGYQALWAGGCVRDQLLGHEPHDYDVATDALPAQVQKLFRRTIAVGASFGVIEVLGPKTKADLLRVQVATFRSDVSYSDGRHPDEVVFSTAEDDAKRRDFTINGMFFDPVDGQVIDYVDGQTDLRLHVIRAIGDPFQRFAEDKLRLLRAVRFAAKFQFTIEAATAAAIRSMATQIGVVSAERVADEIRKLLTDSSRVIGVRHLADVGLLAAILPEWASLPEDTRRHLLLALAALPEMASFPLAFATLLQANGTRTAGKICLRLRLSNDERERVQWLVEMHKSLQGAPQLPMSSLKPILAHEAIGELLALHRANAIAAGESTAHVEFCEQKLRDWPPDVLNPPPLITGDDLHALGLRPGPVYKRLLDVVRVAQLNEVIDSKDAALEMAARFVKLGP